MSREIRDTNFYNLQICNKKNLYDHHKCTKVFKNEHVYIHKHKHVHRIRWVIRKFICFPIMLKYVLKDCGASFSRDDLRDNDGFKRIMNKAIRLWLTIRETRIHAYDFIESSILVWLHSATSRSLYYSDLLCDVLLYDCAARSSVVSGRFGAARTHSCYWILVDAGESVTRLKRTTGNKKLS